MSDICKPGIEQMDCQLCLESQFQIAITDGPIAAENITIDQRYKFEQEIKSLRESIADLQKAVEEIGNKEWVQGSSVKMICTNAIERLKERGHWLEAKSK